MMCHPLCFFQLALSWKNSSKFKFLKCNIKLTVVRRGLAVEAGGRNSVAEQADIQGRRNGLMHRIDQWRETQLIYMPYVAALLDQTDSSAAAPHKAEEIQLYLPSGLSDSILRTQAVSVLLKKELQLRVAQADDALADIRRYRRVMKGVKDFKRFNVAGSGQHNNTRMYTLFQKFASKVKAAASRYRVAFNILRRLDPNGTWTTRLHELLDQHISGPGLDADERRLGDGQRELSWIWRTIAPETSPDDEIEYDDNMRVEWTTTRARALRWNEQVVLLQEEMRRTLAFFEWKAKWWRQQIGQRTDVSDDVQSGLTAYAERHAVMYERLATKFATLWLTLLIPHDISPEWQSTYPKAVEDAREIIAKKRKRAKGKGRAQGYVHVNSDDDVDMMSDDD